jgi:dihydroorotase (EC 3.5.2.3)
MPAYDTNFKMNPPLRSDKDRAAIIEGLTDGTIDMIATDHAPMPKMKNRWNSTLPHSVLWGLKPPWG